MTTHDRDATDALDRDLLRTNDVPGPSPRFVADLRARLLTEAQRLEAVPQPALRPSRSPSPTIRRPSGGLPWRRTGMLANRIAAIALVAALLLLSITTLGGPGSSRPPTAIPAAQPTMPVAMDGGNAARTGVYDAAGPVGAPTIAWRTLVTAPGGLVVAGDRAYYLSLGKEQALAAADLASGAVVWSVPVTMPVFYDVPTVANGLVYMATPQGVTAFDANTGATAWSQDLGLGTNTPSLAVSAGRLFVATHDKTLRALDPMTGAEQWRTTIPDSTEPGTRPMDMLASTTSPTVAGGVVYSVGNGGLLVAYAASDGHRLWTFQGAGELYRQTPLAADGVVVVVAATDGKDTVQAVDAATGAVRWQRDGSNPGGPIAIQDGVLYLGRTGSGGRTLTAVNVADGKQLWTYEAAARVGGIGLADGVLYLTVGDGAIEGIDLTTHAPVMNVELGSVSSVGIGNGLLVASTIDALVAIAATPTTGTPIAATTPIDLSGLPPCAPPREVPAVYPSGTAGAMLDVTATVVGPAVPGTVSQILTTNLPTGFPASGEAIAGIQHALAALNDCVVGRADSPMVGGFFTDDFYRRGWGAGAGPSEENISWPNTSTGAAPTIVQTIAEPDGRVAVIVDFGYGDANRYLIVFTQESDAWLIDEWYRIVDQYQEGKG